MTFGEQNKKSSWSKHLILISIIFQRSSSLAYLWRWRTSRNVKLRGTSTMPTKTWYWLFKTTFTSRTSDKSQMMIFKRKPRIPLLRQRKHVTIHRARNLQHPLNDPHVNNETALARIVITGAAWYTLMHAVTAVTLDLPANFTTFISKMRESARPRIAGFFIVLYARGELSLTVHLVDLRLMLRYTDPKFAKGPAPNTVSVHHRAPKRRTRALSADHLWRCVISNALCYHGNHTTMINIVTCTHIRTVSNLFIFMLNVVRSTLRGMLCLITDYLVQFQG